MATKEQQYTGRLYTQAEVDRMLLEALRQERLANARHWKDKIGRLLDKEITIYSELLKEDV